MVDIAKAIGRPATCKCILIINCLWYTYTCVHLLLLLINPDFYINAGLPALAQIMFGSVS